MNKYSDDSSHDHSHGTHLDAQVNSNFEAHTLGSVIVKVDVCTSTPTQILMTHFLLQMQMHMRLFRAQRNFYISGFALFLCLVIRKMVTLMMTNAVLEVEKEAAIKQASSASKAAEALMDSASGAADSKAEKALKEKDEELKKALKNVESMKIQSENLAKEYDRLMEEKDKLERKVRILDGGADGDKKDD